MANTLKFGAGQWATKEGSTLAYNDENDNYKPLPFTFTRASNATVVNKAGLIETVGNGIPRIDFLGNTQGALKLEPQRTNLITQSEAFPNPYWIKSGATIQGDPSTAGSELIVNGDFATDSDWIKGTGWSISGGSLNGSSTTTSVTQLNTGLVAGKMYQVVYTISNYVSGSVRIELGSANVSVGTIRSANGTYTEYIEALGDEQLIFDGISAFTGSIDNVSVKEVQGFTSPDGTTNAYKLVEGTNNGEHIIYKISIGVTSGATLSYSFFAKKGERNVIQTYNYVGGGFQNGADFDLSTGVVSNQYGGLGSMTELDNGWWRCDFTSLALVGQTGTNVAIRTLDNSSSNSYQGDGTSGFYIYGAQLEEGSYATSYIPTQGSVVTRLADTCSQAVPDGVIGQTEGVLYVDFKFKGLPNNVSSMPISIDGSGSNEAYIYIDVNNTVYGQFIVGGSFTCNISGDNLILGNTYKIAFAYKNSDFALFVNGVLSNSSNSGAVGANQNIVIGNYLNGNYPHDNINEAKLYNTRLTNAELEALTQV